MRIALLAVFVLLGANFAINLLDSNLTDIIKQRNETLQRSIDQL